MGGWTLTWPSSTRRPMTSGRDWTSWYKLSCQGIGWHVGSCSQGRAPITSLVTCSIDASDLAIGPTTEGTCS
jgi:hypothetical protein